MPDTVMLEREWAEIRASGQGDGILEVSSRATTVTTGYGHVRVAIGPQGEPRLLVPVGRPVVGSTAAGSRYLLLARSCFKLGGKLEHFIDITLHNPRLTRVFTELVEEILKRLEMGEGPETAVHGTIQDFRNLLARTSEGEIPLTKLGGLIGVLLVLELLTAKRPQALEGWTGPIGQRHDFRRRDIAIEVKTSLRSDATRVTVHGPEQLLPPLDGRLHLAHVRLEPVDGGPLSVAALHRNIVEHGADEFMLDERLAEMGCRDPQSDEWNGTAFALEGTRAAKKQEDLTLEDLDLLWSLAAAIRLCSDASFKALLHIDVPIDVRIGFLLDLYLHHLKRKYTIKTTVPYESKVTRLKSFLGPLEWQEFSQLDVENYIDHARTLTAWNQKRKSLSDGTIIKDLQVLRAALRHAHLNRIVPYECRIEIRGLVTGTRTDWITQEQMRRVLRRCCTRPVRLHVLGFLLIGLCSAARREAKLSLRWEQVRIPEAG